MPVNASTLVGTYSPSCNAQPVPRNEKTAHPDKTRSTTYVSGEPEIETQHAVIFLAPRPEFTRQRHLPVKEQANVRGPFSKSKAYVHIVTAAVWNAPQDIFATGGSWTR
jgi:hypothetical protein